MTPASIIVGSPMITAPSLVALPRAKMRKAFLRWREQRYNADHRGIPFELTLADWLSIWIGSGRYHQRGRRSGEFVMSRPGDKGPYSVGNVAIVLAQVNLDEGRRHPCAPKTRAKIARRLKGNTNGAGHVASGAARKRMRKGCAERSKTDWLAHTTAANRSLAKRRRNGQGVKAAWARRRAEASR